MKCYNGIMSKKNGMVPCGQCMDCRINEARSWAARILMEQLSAPYGGYFYTWTYDDENIPTTPAGLHTLRKKPWFAWLANQRKDYPFRYYTVGEYGSDTVRPHYHAAIFPKAPFDPRVLLDKWQYGSIKSVRDLIPTRARYLAQYTAKKLTSDTDERLSDGQEPEFRSSSRVPGLGAPFVTTIVSAYRPRS